MEYGESVLLGMHPEAHSQKNSEKERVKLF